MSRSHDPDGQGPLEGAEPHQNNLTLGAFGAMGDILSSALDIAFNGLAFAMVLYLISVGLSVTMRLMGFVNLAHGVFAMAGGYVVTSLMKQWGVPFPLALFGAALSVVAASVPMERLLYRRFYGGDELDQVLLTIALAFMSVGGATYIWGPLQQPLQPPQWLSGPVDLGFRSFPAYRSFLILCGAVLVTELWLAVERTRFGAGLRAAVDNPRLAQSVGIDTSRLFMATFALVSGLAGLGGALGADLLAVNPGYALQNLIYFLIVVAVGGLGSIRGPFFAARLLGVADTSSKYLLLEFGAFFIYALTLAVLLWRPRGLFGRYGASGFASPAPWQSRSGYSAAALAGSTNCETHLFRRLRPSRYMASNSAGSKEWVEGRLINASPHALRRGNFSIWPSFLTRSRKK
jgi:branched-chain amino acid transport system permease protein